MSCNCKEGNIYNIGMGCCRPSIMPADDFYTKPQIDEMLEEIESAITSGNTYYAGRAINIDSGNTISLDLPISAGTGTNSIQEGVDTVASGGISHAEGNNTTASGWFSHSEGYSTSATSEASHAEGQQTIASGYYSHAEGYNTIANNQSEHASGQYNVSNTGATTAQTLFSVGNGTADNDRHNAFEIRKNGDIYIVSGGTDIKLQDHLGGGSGSTGCNCDLSDYVTFEDMGEFVGDVYTKTEVNNLFVTKATFNTYITNLQQQINSLIETISGCCGSTGETEYRWITMTGASDYTCSGTTKMTKEKQQSSVDGGITWTDTGQYRTGSTVLEYNSVDCGYERCVVLSAYTSNGDMIIPNHQEQVEGSITPKTTKQGNMYNNRQIITSITVSDCVNTIGSAAGNDLFYGYTNLTTVILPSTITRIHPNALVWNSGTNITCYAMTPPFMSDGYHYFYTGGNLKIYVPASVVDTYKAANGWSQYANIILPIP